MLASAGLSGRRALRCPLRRNDSKFRTWGRKLKTGRKGGSLLDLHSFCCRPGLAEDGCRKRVTPCGDRGERKLACRRSCCGILMTAVNRLEMDFRLGDEISHRIAQDSAPERSCRTVNGGNQKSR